MDNETKARKSSLFLIVLTIITVPLIGFVAYLFYQNQQLNLQLATIRNPDSTPTIIPSPTVTTSFTPIPTSTPTPENFAEEEKQMRKTLVDFEMYVANGNTAGALTFFTPPVSSTAKAEYEDIRSRNLNFTVKGYRWAENDGVLNVSEIKNGYRAITTECRSNSTTCSILLVEFVKSETAENGFLIDRYYDSSYMSQNNLSEEIKYQGFGF
jgi:hypothetical protein